MANPLLALVLAALVCSVAVRGTADVGRVRAHENGSVLITSAVNGSVLLNGHHPLAEIAALRAENAALNTSLKGVRSVVAGLGIKQWTRQVGTAAAESGSGVAADPQGNVFVAGHTFGDLDGNGNAGAQDVFLVKYDGSGARQWLRQFGTDAEDTLQSGGAAADPFGNVFVVGYTRGNLDGNTNAGGRDAFVVKYNSTGHRLWTHLLGTPAEELGRACSTDNDGNVIVGGSTGGGLAGFSNAGGGDAFVCKFNGAGQQQWCQQFGTSVTEAVGKVTTASDGSIFVAGHTQGVLDGSTNAGGYDMFVRKYTGEGNHIWTRQLGVIGEDLGRAATTDKDGNVIVAGTTFGGIAGNVHAGSRDVYITKYGGDGTQLWTRQFGDTGIDFVNGVATDGFGNVYITGYSSGDIDGHTNAGGNDCFVLKFDAAGIQQWSRHLATGVDDEGTDITVDSSGNIFVTGGTLGDLDGNGNNGDRDIFVTKFGLP